MNATQRFLCADDLYRFRIPSDPQISPDGMQIAFVLKTILREENVYQSHIYLISTQARGDPQLLAQGNSPRWSPDGRQIAFLRNVDGTGEQIYCVPAVGGFPEQVSHLPTGSFGFYCWSPQGSHLAFTFRQREKEFQSEAIAERDRRHRSTPPRTITRLGFKGEGSGIFGAEQYNLYLLEISSGTVAELISSCNGERFSFSPDGRTIAVLVNLLEDADLFPKALSLFLIQLSDGSINHLSQCPPGPKYGLEFSPDGNLIAFRGHLDSQEGLFDARDVHLWICNIEGIVRDVTDAFDLHFAPAALNDVTGAGEAGPSWDIKSRSLYTLASEQGATVLLRVSGWADGQTYTERIAPQLGSILGFTFDSVQRSAAVLCATPQDAGDLYLFTPETGVMRQLTWLNRDFLEERRVVDPVAFRATAPAGHHVSGWAYLPETSVTGQPPPGIVNIHGGPHLMHDANLLNHEIQTLVGAGYAVVVQDPRGSKGYGQSWSSAIVGLWDAPGIEDVLACVDHAEANSWIDPNRLGVMGGSYGAYLTATLITATDRFKAAIAERGVYALLSMVGTCDQMIRDFGYFQANTTDAPQEYICHSPLTYAAKITTPLLLLHGEGDLRCPIQQTEQMFYAMRQLKKPVTMLRYGKEATHGLSRTGPPDLRLDRLNRIQNWFEQHGVGSERKEGK